MSTAPPVTILCVTSYIKGEEFMRECKRQGCRVLLLSVEKHREAEWPRESIDEIFYMPDLGRRPDVIHGVSWLARSERLDRIVALDEFDLEMVASLREHLRLPGMGETTVRLFRDKLAMRRKARELGIAVPDFISIFHRDDIRDFMERVPPPWVLKPRTSASAIGIRKLSHPDEVWSTLDQLGDEQSFHLLERFVPGDVMHVDSLVFGGEVLFDECHRYARPPFDVYHGGGLFSSRTERRGSDAERELRELNRQILEGFGMRRGAVHTEFIRGAEDGRLYFLETAARVGGANIVDTVEAATGVNLWREWARLEVADARGEAYRVPEHRTDYAGVLISLARQEWPDTSAYQDPEIVWRLSKRHHAGLIVASPDPERVAALLDDYSRRFYEDFHASMPAAERPND